MQISPGGECAHPGSLGRLSSFVGAERILQAKCCISRNHAPKFWQIASLNDEKYNDDLRKTIIGTLDGNFKHAAGFQSVSFKTGKPVEEILKRLSIQFHGSTGEVRLGAIITPLRCLPTPTVQNKKLSLLNYLVYTTMQRTSLSSFDPRLMALTLSFFGTCAQKMHQPTTILTTNRSSWGAKPVATSWKRSIESRKPIILLSLSNSSWMTVFGVLTYTSTSTKQGTTFTQSIPSEVLHPQHFSGHRNLCQRSFRSANWYSLSSATRSSTVKVCRSTDGPRTGNYRQSTHMSLSRTWRDPNYKFQTLKDKLL